MICVVKHNQMDLRGLAALFGKINALLDAREDIDDEANSLDLFGLSKFLHRKGEKDRAHSACARALVAGLPAEFRPQATRDLALMAKRRGDREREPARQAAPQVDVERIIAVVQRRFTHQLAIERERRGMTR